MTIKELFTNAENGTLTYEQFEARTKEHGIKLADLSEGKYVSKSKYDSDLKAKDVELEGINARVTDLTGTIATRDKDLADLQTKLEAAGQDATKLAALNQSIRTKWFANLYDYSGGTVHTLTLNATFVSYLEQETINVVTAKGWTIQTV